MAKGILGKKIGMTQIFSEAGLLIPVTVIEVTPNVVLQKKVVATDGYNAIQLGYDDKKAKSANKAEVGQLVKANIFVEGEMVDVTGTSKGKGYQGVIKRHNFHIGPMSHGSGYHRGIGSMGSIDPARVKPGKKMAGRMGGETTTIQNLELVKYDEKNNVILVKGNVPGAKNSYVVITNANKAHKPAVNPEALA